MSAQPGHDHVLNGDSNFDMGNLKTEMILLQKQLSKINISSLVAEMVSLEKKNTDEAEQGLDAELKEVELSIDALHKAIA
ncbi:hypothetical protein A1F94_008204 [Pyrenophora tritici-repentis]|nr:hypothetical protein A1F94_008204 [Pyrenophora tritici-repentis]KAI1516142.1 hypothetical protein Ptr86124_004679 [Pyrenophora tritici-repentis]KAI1685452.1 hypothetical protein KJE20_05736 [Pyrenophora tritici-repentis]